MVHVCHTLGIMYTFGGLENQPAWFISKMMAYISAKRRAEEALQKKNQEK